MESQDTFKLTYGTMFNPPEELHQCFSAALSKTKADLGREYGMLINGKDHFTADKFEDRSPADTSLLLGIFQKGGVEDAARALAAARAAFPKWSRTPWQERIALVRKAADLIDQRLYDLGVAMALEVGKNRMESLGDVAEVADLMRYACSRMEASQGFTLELGKDPLPGLISTNHSILRPYGVWVVISPFNFPASLTLGPAGTALVAGNTVVMKPATDTPWVPRLLAECLRDAGLPDGVFNYVTGPGSTLGQALIEHPEVDGMTFTGSYDVGMALYRAYANGCYVRPIILELGGKNAVVVSRHANLDDAEIGIVRSVFGLQGQKCSACSRIFVESSVYEELTARLAARTQKLIIGDPTEREVYLGPVINKAARQDYEKYIAELRLNGRMLIGGRVLTEGPYAHGHFCTPTLVADLPLENHLWQQEMFLPIATLAKVTSIGEGIKWANSSQYGLTAGFYGSPEEAELFLDQIEAGVIYTNRPLGATTGAWPGYQPFGGWKGSGSSGKNAGGHYYLQQYLHEQIQNRVRKG
jgi:1-pyrroline-5-carboxylate dehydrogenase